MKWLRRALVAVAALLLVVAGVAVGTALKAPRPVGFQQWLVLDEAGAKFPLAVWYPTSGSPRPTTLIGMRLMNVAPDGPVAGKAMPLVLISHGNGGGPASHADLAMALAASGYVVAAPMHEGDNFLDQGALKRPGWLAGRTRELRESTDFMLKQWSGRDRIDPRRVGAFGFSAGGATVLAAVGARPDLGMIPGYCAKHAEFVCEILRQATSPLLRAGTALPPLPADPRIRAVAVAAPGFGFTMGGQALDAVTAPVQLWNAGDDVNVPGASNADVVREALGQRVEYHIVPNAGHMAFLAPCGPIGPPALCKDAGGFERQAFHTHMNASVIGFFDRTLVRAPTLTTD